MVLLYSHLHGVDFNVTPEGNLSITNTQVNNDILGELSFSVLSSDRPEIPLPAKVKIVRQEGKGLTFLAESAPLSIEGRITPMKEGPHFQFRLNLTNRAMPGAFSLSVYFRTLNVGNPRFLIPGIFYKHNRPDNCTRIYPAFSLNPSEKKDSFFSNYWSFRSDRTAESAVFAWTDLLGCVLSTSSVFDKGQSGLYFKADTENLTIGLHFPYREEPLKYSFCHPSKNASEYTFFFLDRREIFSVNFDFSVTVPDLHFYAPYLRSLYERGRNKTPTNPWMEAHEANALLAHGLFNWHYNEKEAVIWETCVFDKYYGKKDSYVDRFNMHLAWVSGAPAAMSLLWYGRNNKNQDYINAGTRVLDKVASGIAPLGTFYPCWMMGKGWTSGWNPQDNLAQARTAAETTLFMLRAYRMELKRGFVHPHWMETVKKSLDFAASIQDKNGNFGSYYHLETGEVTQWEGAGGILWIAPLIGASVFMDNPSYRQAAISAGEYYKKFIDDEFLFGAPEDVHLTPTSEDGYNALISYLLLAEITHEQKWLELARKAADWLLTFRFTYNSRFPKHTILEKYNFHTKGGDVASPSNQHLHTYGLVCHPELMRLGRYLEDDYYLERAREHLEFAHQFIAREDADFGARKGMVPEQFFHTDWWQPKGHLLALSHAWCAGLILYANLWEQDILGASSLRMPQKLQLPESEPDVESSHRLVAFSRTPTEESPPSERETLFDV